MKKLFWISFAVVLFTGCKPNNDKEVLRTEIEKVFSAVKGNFSLAYKNLNTGDTLFIRADRSYHAASTMKTPVMVEVFRQAGQGKFSLNDSLVLTNTFKSILDSSEYSLFRTDDSDTSIYDHIGEKRTIYSLMYDMIIVSSNMATNLIIDLVGARNVESMMQEQGLTGLHVLRGVEDKKAYRAGLSNTTEARDQLRLYEMIENHSLADSASSAAMINILLDQKFRDILPAQLPEEIKIAHKSGSIAGLAHDGGIIFLPDDRRYVLILLSDELEDEAAGVNAMATVSKLIYDYTRTH
jgi:beta-lactamase class A